MNSRTTPANERRAVQKTGPGVPSTVESLESLSPARYFRRLHLRASAVPQPVVPLYTQVDRADEVSVQVTRAVLLVEH